MEEILDENERNVKFRELIKLPKREHSQSQRMKTFTSHFLSSPENPAKIKAAHEVAMCKEALAKARQEALKKVIAEEKEAKNKKKVTCRADTVRARELPARGRWRGRGRGRGRGGGLLMHLNCNVNVDPFSMHVKNK